MQLNARIPVHPDDPAAINSLCLLNLISRQLKQTRDIREISLNVT